jgi:anthranilate synthase component 1
VPVYGMPILSGGMVGYLSYETSGRFEDLPSPQTDPLCLPEAVFMLANTLLIFDHVSHRVIILSHAHIEGNTEAAYAAACKRIDDLADRLAHPLPATEPPAAKSHYDSGVSSNMTRGQYEAAVGKAREYITAGECIQVVVSQRLAVASPAEPFDIYRALRTINPSPYMFFIHLGDFHIFGASPEMLLRVEDGTVTTHPIAGTRPRGGDCLEDQSMADELLHDEKERAEHVMLVDLGRNDIGRISEPGSVTISDLMSIERYSHVMHMVTHVQGRLSEGRTCFDALRACFPAGTVSGAPKIRAMQIIAELEPDKRGPYAGAVGYFSHSGNMDMAIAIRTMVIKDGTAYVQAGAGIVYDSVPAREYEESLNKARALLKAVEQAGGAPVERRKHAGANR